MGRAILKTLKQTTLLTFFDILREWGVIHKFKYNHLEGVITYIPNGSQIYLKDLFAYPSDPEFDSLGSSEYTGAFIDEASQITVKAKNIVMSRIRYKLDEFGLIPKLLITSNPYKNFMYSEFYKPHKDGSLPKYRKFLPSLVTDNPFISKFYVENLKKLDKTSRERLLHGNWEYEDDPAALFPYEDLLNMFTNTGKGTEKYLTVDVARFGNDRTVIIYWEGMTAKKIYSYPKTGVDETIQYCKNLAAIHQIKYSNVIVDEDGVGGGVVDVMKVTGFVNNSKPIKIKNLEKKGSISNYSNLKSQCYFYLADMVNKGEIAINPDIDATIKELIIEDLEQIKRKNPDRDSKLAVIGKEEIKDNIGRSPDFGDAIMMRMYPEVKKRGKAVILW